MYTPPFLDSNKTIEQLERIIHEQLGAQGTDRHIDLENLFIEIGRLFSQAELAVFISLIGTLRLRGTELTAWSQYLATNDASLPFQGCEQTLLQTLLTVAEERESDPVVRLQLLENIFLLAVCACFFLGLSYPMPADPSACTVPGESCV